MRSRLAPTSWPIGHQAADRGFFLKPDAAVVPALGAVSSWTTNQRYDPAAVNTFLQVADYYLVAHALSHGHTVVTHETPAFSAKKIKIPNVCIGLDIKCMTPFEMLRVEKARFVLGGTAGSRGAEPEQLTLGEHQRAD
jgi:hypothetical protein